MKLREFYNPLIPVCNAIRQMGGIQDLLMFLQLLGWFGEKQGNSLHGTQKLQEVNVTCNAECENLQGVD